MREKKVSGSFPSPPGEEGSDRLPVVGVGASAGGLSAFREFLSAFPSYTRCALVFLQHLDPSIESILPGLLQKETSFKVIPVGEPLLVKSGCLYVVTPGTLLHLHHGLLTPTRMSPGTHLVHLLDEFFLSLAEDRKERAAGVLLSGAGTDGSLGLAAIRNNGGVTYAQNRSATFPSMPQSAIEAHAVDHVLSAGEIARDLAVRLSGLSDSGALRSPEGGVLPEGMASPGQAPATTEDFPGESLRILSLLRDRTGVDLSIYKPRSVLRRIDRRMRLSGLADLPAYYAFLSDNPPEVQTLLSDILVNVTRFFRDEALFAHLSRRVIPELIRENKTGVIRVWVAGCATGQEAYSLAILFSEYCQHNPSAPHVGIFATDLCEHHLKVARAGLYSGRLMEGVSPGRRERFFVREKGGYRITGQIRDMIVFARHNLLKDPPFSRIDLVSCRNLLIYLSPDSQMKALRLFHYALLPEGLLVLGLSESAGITPDLFSREDKRLKIFRKNPAKPDSRRTYPLNGGTGGRAQAAFTGIGSLFPLWQAEREVSRILMADYAPPGVLINEHQEIVQFLGSVSDYLEPSPGKPSNDLLSQAKSGLLIPLKKLLSRVKEERKASCVTGVSIHGETDAPLLTLRVIPLKNLKAPFFLVLFEEEGRVGTRPLTRRVAPSLPESERLLLLESELSETKDYLDSLNNQHQSMVEELEASAEEIQSANEELQSTNEEIETSNAELESANEELSTLNARLAERNSDLLKANSDLENLSVSINTAIVVVNRDLSLRKKTPMADKLFRFSSDPPLDQIGQVFNIGDLEPFVRTVIAEGSVSERELKDGSGRWFLLRLRPYLTEENRIDGAVLVFFDITAIKANELEIDRKKHEIELIFNMAPVGLVVLSQDLSILMANDSFLTIVGSHPEEIRGRSLLDLGQGDFSRGGLQELFHRAVSEGSPIGTNRALYDDEKNGMRTLMVGGRRLDPDDGSPKRLLLSVEDVTEKNQASEMDRLNADLDEMALSGANLEEMMALLPERLESVFSPGCVSLATLKLDDSLRFHGMRGNNLFLVDALLKKAAIDAFPADGWGATILDPKVAHRVLPVSEIPKSFPYKKLFMRHGIVEIHTFPFFKEMKGGRIKGALFLGFSRPNALSVESVFRISHTLSRFSVLVEHFGEQETLHLQNTALNLVPNGVLITDPDRKILWVNKAMTTLSGYSEQELIGQTPRILHSGKQDRGFYRSMWETIRNGRVFEGRIVDRRKDGSFYTVETVIIPMMDADGVVTHYVGVQKDVRDSLTGLLNRTSLNDRLHMEIDRNIRNGTFSVVLFLDIDGFKAINDTMGHETGDRLLQEIGSRLSESLRSSDFVARWGGDEFVVVMTDVTDMTSVSPFVGKVLSLISTPAEIDGAVIHVTASIGIAIAPKDSDNVGEILKKADIAMFQAKGQGKNTFKIFDYAMEEEIRAQYDQENSLKLAIPRGEFQLFFQPQVDVLKDQLIGVEALIRWNHPERGLVLPGKFIPLAERTGLIIELGNWVLAEVFRTIARWMEAGFPRLRVGVNVSAAQFWHPPFWEMLEKKLDADPQLSFWLDLELTESVLLKDPAEAANLILKMRRRGVRMTLDDFGTGYSSLAYLAELSLDAIKIPQEFVIPMHDSPPKKMLVKTIIQMARLLNLDMVGEGAETMDDVETLSLFGCNVIQGFALSRPLPLSEIEIMMKKKTPLSLEGPDAR